MENLSYEDYHALTLHDKKFQGHEEEQKIQYSDRNLKS